MSYYGMSGDTEVLGGNVDILGDDDLLGDDDMLGAFNFGRAANMALNPLAQINALRRAAGGGGRRAPQRARAISKPITESRRLLMGLDTVTTVAAAGVATITANPVEPFRPEALIVDSVVAPNFLITQVLIGRKSQLVGTGSLPASAFVAPGSAVGSLQWDTAQTAQPLQVSINNTSGGASRFTAVLIGTAIG